MGISHNFQNQSMKHYFSETNVIILAGLYGWREETTTEKEAGNWQNWKSIRPKWYTMTWNVLETKTDVMSFIILSCLLKIVASSHWLIISCGYEKCFRDTRSNFGMKACDVSVTFSFLLSFFFFFSDTQFLFIFQPEKRKANTAGTAPCQSTSSTFSTLLNLSALMRGDAKVFVSVHIYIHIVEFCQEWQRVRDWNENKPKEKRISKK